MGSIPVAELRSHMPKVVAKKISIYLKKKNLKGQNNQMKLILTLFYSVCTKYYHFSIFFHIKVLRPFAFSFVAVVLSLQKPMYILFIYGPSTHLVG